MHTHQALHHAQNACARVWVHGGMRAAAHGLVAALPERTGRASSTHLILARKKALDTMARANQAFGALLAAQTAPEWSMQGWGCRGSARGTTTWAAENGTAQMGQALSLTLTNLADWAGWVCGLAQAQRAVHQCPDAQEWMALQPTAAQVPFLVHVPNTNRAIELLEGPDPRSAFLKRAAQHFYRSSTYGTSDIEAFQSAYLAGIEAGTCPLIWHGGLALWRPLFHNQAAKSLLGRTVARPEWHTAGRYMATVQAFVDHQWASRSPLSPKQMQAWRGRFLADTHTMAALLALVHSTQRAPKTRWMAYVDGFTRPVSAWDATSARIVVLLEHWWRTKVFLPPEQAHAIVLDDTGRSSWIPPKPAQTP